MAKTNPTHDHAYEATLQPYPTAGIIIDIERIAGEAESACEFDPHDGLPVVVVNWAGAAIITSTFQREVFWTGVALPNDSACNLLAHLVRILGRCVKAQANLKKLIDDVVQALSRGSSGRHRKHFH